MTPMGFGDGLLRFNGIGERITSAMYNNDKPDRSGKGPVLPRSQDGRPSAA